MVSNRYCLALIVLVLGPAALAQTATQPSAALMETGKLQAVAAQSSRLLALGLDGRTIHLDRDYWQGSERPKKAPGEAEREDPAAAPVIRPGIRPGIVIGVGVGGNAGPAEAIFRQIQAAAGPARGGSSMGLGPRGRSIRFQGEELSGSLEVAEDRVRIGLTEETGAGRRLEVSDDKAGAFRLTLIAESGDLIMISQSKKGIAMAAIVDGRAWSATAADYLELYRQNRAVLDQVVFPALAHNGVTLLVSPYRAEVRRAVLAALLPADADAATAARGLIAALDADDFDARERATAALAENYDRYRGAIEEKLRDPAISAEARQRLQALTDRHAQHRDVTALITALDLLNDPRYLVTLLTGSRDAERTLVADRLRKLTHQDLGESPEAWQRWLAQQR